jgi:hypothetical protein
LVMRMRTGKAIQLLRKPNCCANARVPPVAEVPAGSAVLPGSSHGRCAQSAKSKEQRAKSKEQRAKNKEQTKSKQRANKEHRAVQIVDDRVAIRRGVADRFA